MPVVRHACVPGPRLSGWLQRFEHAHGPLELRLGDEGLVVDAAGGARAVLRAPWPDDGRPGRGADDIARLASLAGQARPVALLLIRRGGWAAGVAVEGRLLESKTGSARGMSGASGGPQQRQARRRANQADALAEAAAAAAAACIAAATAAGTVAQYLVSGGDRLLVRQVLAQPVLKPWRQLPLLPPVQVQEPNPAALRRAAADAACVTVRIELPG